MVYQVSKRADGKRSDVDKAVEETRAYLKDARHYREISDFATGVIVAADS